MQVVMVGQVCIDQNTAERENYRGWGSALMYMAQYYKDQLALTPQLISPHGRDFLTYSTGFELSPGPSKEPTLLYMNTTNTYPRRWQCFNSQSAQPVALSTDLKKMVSEADILYLAPLLPNYPLDYVTELLSYKKEAALSVLQAAGYLRRVDAHGRVQAAVAKDFEAIASRFELVFLSDDDIGSATTRAADWAKKLSTNFIVTQGPLGASWFSLDGAVENLAAEVVNEEQIVDSVGCGDVFCAAASFNYYHHRSVRLALKAGNYDARQKLFQGRLAGKAARLA